MPTAIRAREAALYREAWGLEAYGAYAPGARYADLFASLVTPAATVLDAGCGSGKGGLALAARGFHVTLADQTDEGLTDDARALPFREICLWDDLLLQIGRFDYVYCCDVLEHLPTAFTMLVVARLLSIARRGLFLSISLTPDQFGVWLGTPLHQTVQPFMWWRDALRELGAVVDARDLMTTGLYVVEPAPRVSRG